MMYEPPLEPYCDYNPIDDYVHIDELSKYDDAKDLINKLINILYKSGDVLQFENDFEDLASIFDVNLPFENIKIKQNDDESIPLIRNRIKGEK